MTALVVLGTVLQVVGVFIAMVGIHNVARGLSLTYALWYVRLWNRIRRRTPMHYVCDADTVQVTDASVSKTVVRAEPATNAPLPEWVRYSRPVSKTWKGTWLTRAAKLATAHTQRVVTAIGGEGGRGLSEASLGLAVTLLGVVLQGRGAVL